MPAELTRIETGPTALSVRSSAVMTASASLMSTVTASRPAERGACRAERLGIDVPERKLCP